MDGRLHGWERRAQNIHHKCVCPDFFLTVSSLSTTMPALALASSKPQSLTRARRSSSSSLAGHKIVQPRLAAGRVAAIGSGGAFFERARETRIGWGWGRLCLHP